MCTSVDGNRGLCSESIDDSLRGSLCACKGRAAELCLYYDEYERLWVGRQTYEGLCQLRPFARKQPDRFGAREPGDLRFRILQVPSLDRSRRQKSPMLERQPEIVTLGSFCTFKTECASISADCMTRAGKKGRCQCGNGTIWNGKTCVEETIALLPLNLQFDGKQTAKLKSRVDELPIPQLHHTGLGKPEPGPACSTTLALNFGRSQRPPQTEPLGCVDGEWRAITNANRSTEDLVTGSIRDDQNAKSDRVALKCEREILWLSAGKTVQLQVNQETISTRFDETQQLTGKIKGIMCWVEPCESESRSFIGCIRGVSLAGKPLKREDIDGNENLCDCETGCGIVEKEVKSKPKKQQIEHPFWPLTFNGTGFVEFENLRIDVRNRVEVTLQIRPRSSDGLLFYWGSLKDGRSSGDFLALYLVASQPHFFWNLGSGIAYVKATPISNHNWSTIEFGRTGRDGHISVDRGFANKQTSLPKNTHLDVSGFPLFIGGVTNFEKIPPKLRSLNRTFLGEIRFVSINEQPILITNVSSTNCPYSL
ncbi:unnamed protein product, partial [Mesorhabditis belari]|uniref:Laminin G domain-containing protein n=1 Tax=Mesorhabditis belari TaxID=2138241 RepID=A0AAF3J7N9_9BILA